MDTFVFIGIIFLILAVLFEAWRLYQIATNIDDLQYDKYSKLTKRLDNIMTSISISKNELSSTIRNSENSIKNHITTENRAIRQLIMAQFSSQTSKLVEDAENNRQSISSLMNMIQSLHSQTNKGVKENSNKIGKLNISISNAIEETSERIKQLSSDGQQHSKSVLAGIDFLFRNLSEYNKAIEHHLKKLEENDDKNTKHIDAEIDSLSISLRLYKENITSMCTRILDTEQELHQKTKSSFDLMNGQLSKYQQQLKQIDILYDNLQKLYSKLLNEEEKIAKQESSLTTMVSRHSQIFEITSEMNNTSKEIFEFMKLYLIQSTLENFKNN